MIDSGLASGQPAPAMGFALKDWSHVRLGEKCQAYMGAGWSKGELMMKHGDAVTVRLDGSKRVVRVFDPRNVKPC